MEPALLCRRRWTRTFHPLLGLKYIQCACMIQGIHISLVPPLKVQGTKKLIWARLGVSRPIYVNVDSPNLGFQYFNFWGGYQWKKTLYLSFCLHRQDFLVKFCSTQKCLNRDKIYFASKQRKSWQDSGSVFCETSFLFIRMLIFVTTGGGVKFLKLLQKLKVNEADQSCVSWGMRQISVFLVFCAKYTAYFLMFCRMSWNVLGNVYFESVFSRVFGHCVHLISVAHWCAVWVAFGVFCALCAAGGEPDTRTLSRATPPPPQPDLLPGIIIIAQRWS